MSGPYLLDTPARSAQPVLPVSLEPVAEHALALVEQPRPPHTVQSRTEMLPVASVAEHDQALAMKLRERLDFSQLLKNGSAARLSDVDAYTVLKPKEFARYEVIASNLRASNEVFITPTIVGVLGGVLVAFGAGVAIALSHDTTSAVVISGVVASLGIAGLVHWFDCASRESKRLIEDISSKLAALGNDRDA